MSRALGVGTVRCKGQEFVNADAYVLVDVVAGEVGAVLFPEFDVLTMSNTELARL